ncbi:MAG: oxidoreductase [Candidatus Promineifilaceae bacterium]|nr:oxidoreductase [Candidatus Promineifilaceae bacterium]
MSDSWTRESIPDLSGKVAIVTGANSGIGYDTAEALAENGATVIMACRNLEKGQAALERLTAGLPDANVELMQLDLASLASVRHFADAFQAQNDRLDILVNNAGIMMVPYGKTEDGFERQMGTNHLGHFALTGLLLDTILATPEARVVNVSSNGHRMGTMDFDNLLFEGGKGYGRQRAYARSKLANLLFTYELQRRFEAAGADAEALAAHPGSSYTGLADHLIDRWYLKPLVVLLRPIVTQSSAMGALTTLRAAVDPNAKGGEYYGPGGFLEQRGYPIVVESNAASHNRADAQKLWQVSEQLTGVQVEL